MNVEFKNKFTNKDALERLSQTQCAHISKLIWIAGSWENDRDIRDFLDDADEDFFKNFMPQLSEGTEDKMAALINNQLYGLLAEVHLPKNKNFSFLDDKPVSWSVSMGHCEVEHIYAETLEGLIVEMEKLTKAKFEREWQKELNEMPPII